ncbi:GNAT family N-acetyltransferase [Sphingomonas sp. M1-B02]|uniref:GNAT family N-acetyltransferase n=1 Tax=Sphingomonas sp. M1-B02 TaxID=3114300 RepID=UPI00223FE86C|nr:GNAT family N-acetyltransferase [Sphingomonas sp. S6-11]UZK65905.1 GNAT family N-acetyltransferase [Sphingomonas sp. S6-11]
MADGDTWRVREASADDARALALVGAATFLDAFAGVLQGEAIVAHCARVHSDAAYRNALAGGARAWLAESVTGGAPIGYALLGTPDLPGAQAGDVELKRIYLLARFHGSGAGAALMQAAVAAAGGHERLLLGVYAGNARAIAFYRRQGFVPVGERQFDVGGTLHDDLVFARPLAS